MQRSPTPSGGYHRYNSGSIFHGAEQPDGPEEGSLHTVGAGDGSEVGDVRVIQDPLGSV